MADLFLLTDLAAAAQQDLDTATATVARNVATGWLQGACRVDEWLPDAITGLFPADLSAWALELALLFIDNPTSNRDERVDDYSRSKSEGIRLGILRDASKRYGRYGAITVQLV
jgi:hypothetical protein